MKKNILIIILAIIALGLGVFIAYDKLIKESPCTKCGVDTDKGVSEVTKYESYEDKEGTVTKTYMDDIMYLSIDVKNKKSVKVENNFAKAHPDLGISEEATLTFDKNVESIFSGTLSINMGGVYFFLMEDGTVEYMRYSDIYLRNSYEHKVLKDVSNVVKFENISVNYDPAGTKKTTLAYKIDGTFYDLSKYGILDGDGVDR